jgi:hypothetical protein
VFGWPLWHGGGDGFAHHVKIGVARRCRHVTPLAVDAVLSIVDPAKPDLVDFRRHGFAQISYPKANEMKQEKKKLWTVCSNRPELIADGFGPNRLELILDGFKKPSRIG